MPWDDHIDSERESRLLNDLDWCRTRFKEARRSGQWILAAMFARWCRELNDELGALYQHATREVAVHEGQQLTVYDALASDGDGERLWSWRVPDDRSATQ